MMRRSERAHRRRSQAVITAENVPQRNMRRIVAIAQRDAANAHAAYR
jgi:hypothetical protein